MTAEPGDPIQQLANEVAALRDLFQRRLLDDRAKQTMYDELYGQLKFAQQGLAEQFIAPMVRELLLVVDRLDGLAAAVPGESADLLESVRAELLEVLLRRGLRTVDAEGQAFDPRLHEAVERLPVTDDAQVGQVLAVRRPGYQLEDRLLRPAQVSVGYKS
jgi:molecular chaperone GrpE